MIHQVLLHHRKQGLRRLARRRRIDVGFCLDGSRDQRGAEASEQAAERTSPSQRAEFHLGLATAPAPALLAWARAAMEAMASLVALRTEGGKPGAAYGLSFGVD